MERSFARSTRYDFDHARWRGLWKMKIQEYLTCALQNIQALIRYGSKPQKAVAARVKARQIAPEVAKATIMSAIEAVLWPLNIISGLFFKEHESVNQR
jgi:hypothetical protein